MQCPHCQQPNPHTNKFCQSCGANLRPEPSPPVRVVRRIPAQQAPPYAQPAQPPYPQPVPPPHPHQAPAWSHPAPAGQPWVAQAKSQPVYLLLLVAAAIGLVALFFQWEPASAYGRPTYTTRGFEYSDGTRSTWTRPEAVVTYYGGSNGFEPVKLVLLAFLAGSALSFRQRPWPRWARYTLAGAVAFMGLIAVGNLLFYPGVGVVLFTMGTGLAGWAAFRILRSPAL